MQFDTQYYMQCIALTHGVGSVGGNALSIAEEKFLEGTDKITVKNREKTGLDGLIFRGCHG